MPYASNPADGVRTYFEDWGGDGTPVLVYAGLADALREGQETGLAGALRDEFRLVFADHRGHGRSDKPHDPGSYALPTRVADACSVLDALDISRAHFLGFSWGARLGFAVGEHAPERVLSLVLCGNQPYAWDAGWPFVPALTAALDTAQEEGMRGFVESLETSFGDRLPEPARSRVLDNDPAASRAAWRSALSEGAISPDLTRWRLRCLIYLAEGEDMWDNAARAAAEIPGSRLLSLRGHSHLSAPDEVEAVLPHVRELFRSTSDRPQPVDGSG